jgi:hypothetical protein
VIGSVSRTFIHFLLAGLITLPVAILLLRTYRSAIGRWMRVPAGGPPPMPSGPPPLPRSGPPLEVKWTDASSSSAAGSATAQALAGSARHGRNMAGLVYGTAGLLHAAATTVIAVALGHYSFTLTSMIAFFLVLAWPTVVLVGKITVARRSARWLIPAALVGATFLLAGRYGSLMIDLWELYVLPPLLMLLCVSARRFRTAGLLVFPSVFLVLTCTRHTLFASGSWPLALGAMVLSSVLVFGLLYATSWLYEKKVISEVSLTLDMEWLFLTIWQTFCLSVHVGYFTAVGLIPFAVYKAAVLVGRKLTRGSAAENCPLLLLRTFGARTRSEGLLDQLGMSWRWIGSIQLIGAPDVAGAYMEPREFLALITGRMRGSFVQDEVSLDRRLASLDWHRDPDGRFRVNDCFCFDRIWRKAVERLLGQSRAVLMDLRAFTAKRAGCVEELTILMNCYPLKKIVFLVDGTTDRPGLTSVLQTAWANRSATSPNGDDARVLELFGTTSRKEPALRKLLDLLCGAAS